MYGKTPALRGLGVTQRAVIIEDVKVPSIKNWNMQEKWHFSDIYGIFIANEILQHCTFLIVAQPTGPLPDLSLITTVRMAATI